MKAVIVVTTVADVVTTVAEAVTIAVETVVAQVVVQREIN
jgi:hypothetical protein